ncbi:MAG: hypothetical protein IPM66_22140 [Acidobacteriota bacterium]|nr:MAG: hypothetical protein IPM66_22140 [Acidobacteriota bacterium]
MKRLSIALSLMLIFSPTLLAAEDLTGTWSGSFNITMNGETKEDSAYIVLKQNGTELTGTAGPNSGQQWQILKGKIEGDKVTFEVQTDEPLIKFELTLVDGHLKGKASAEHQGTALSAEVDVQRKTD